MKAICCLALLSDDEKALMLYEKALRIYPEDWEIYFDMGQRFFSSGLFEDALEKLTKARLYCYPPSEGFGMMGYQRALLYCLAAETGLRRDGLKSLKKSSFDFEALTVKVQVTYSKNRRLSVLFLRKNAAADLQTFVADKLSTAQVFKVPEKTSDMIRLDLTDAGISHIDDAGHFADFHALRHSTGSLLAASGAHPKVVQSIMRHSDINLTMNRYTHVLRGQEFDAVEGLSDLSVPSSEAQ